MGINYRLLDRENEAEEKREKEEPKEERAAMLAPPSPSKREEAGEDHAPDAVTPEAVAKMDEDTV